MAAIALLKLPEPFRSRILYAYIRASGATPTTGKPAFHAVAVLHAVHFVALVHAGAHHGADGRVHAGCVTAGNKHCNPFHRGAFRGQVCPAVRPPST